MSLCEKKIFFILTKDIFYYHGLSCAIRNSEVDDNDVCLFFNYRDLVERVITYDRKEKGTCLILFVDYMHQLVLMDNLHFFFDAIFDKEITFHDVNRLLLIKRKSELKKTPTFSRAELVFLRLYISGASDTVISKVMKVGHKTVSRYRISALRKLNVKSKTKFLMDLFSLHESLIPCKHSVW